MIDELYMRRCFQLALKGGKATKKNPQVGAVLVYKNKIIGEGYHEEYGKAHAEVNCFESVKSEDKALIPDSTLYVSLEPCCIHGKTPPCTDLIIRSGVKKVVISTLDINLAVHGKGVSQLESNGILVKHGVLNEAGIKIIRKFKINHLEKRPYILLKIVKSKDNFIGQQGKNIWLSNSFTGYYTHKIRSECDGILAGSTTIVNDNPSLNTRHYPGDSPIRISFDRGGKIPLTAKFFNLPGKAIYVTTKKRNLPDFVKQILLPNSLEIDLLKLMKRLYSEEICSLIVEGGSELQKHFINTGLWDRTLVVTSEISLKKGIQAQNITGKLIEDFYLDNDHIQIIDNENQ